jgi:hypothetical protein
MIPNEINNRMRGKSALRSRHNGIISQEVIKAAMAAVTIILFDLDRISPPFPIKKAKPPLKATRLII